MLFFHLDYNEHHLEVKEMSVDDFLLSSGRKNMNIEWKGNFNDYFQLALKRPEITQLSVQRLYQMILSHGTSEDEYGHIKYHFFDGRIFGADSQIRDIMMYLKAASMGLDIKKRVLLLLGPPGGGKSQILTMMKKGLADYSKTDKGAIFAIESCPINEDPLHLIPESDRPILWQKHGIRIEGKLCPRCQFMFENDWKRNLNNVPVRRVFVSEDNRVGVGTFAPAEKNDMSELVGSADLSKVDYYGNEGDVRAYAFNGELHTANRGIMEFIEVLKAKSDFLHVLLTLAEEQQFKTPRFPLQYVDEALIAHTNEGEFYRFIGNKENEAIVDRLFIVRVPYNMDVLNEERIYHYALKTKLVVKDVSVHPGAVRLASMFAIRTREHTDPLRHGMQGISPRFILNALAISMVQTHSKVVAPKDMLRVLRHQIFHYPVLPQEMRDLYLRYLDDLEASLRDVEQVTNEEVQFKVKPKKKTDGGLFDRMIGDDYN